jgi:hypothetical protein
MNRLTTTSAHGWVFADPQHPRLDLIRKWAKEAPPRTIQVNDVGKSSKLIPGRRPVAT